VQSIKEQSQMIPVLGHAEGICHVFLDKDADHQKAIDVSVTLFLLLLSLFL
jgi:delta-1-pyrroline-5-carboxylate synthetase